jgi:glycosyltransferase involved in cell wall biosynthesis
VSSPLVSVILPVYNSEKYLEKCIQSVLNQSYKNIELVIINDGSTDESESICNKFSELDSRVRYFFQENRGPSVARNKGIALAEGEYIQFIDSDDYLEEHTIEVLTKNSNGVELVIGAYKNIFSNSMNKNEQSVIPDKIGVFSINEILDSLGAIIKKQLFHYTWHKIYDKKIASKVNFNEEIKIGEDMIFNLSYMKYVKNIRIVNDIVYNHTRFNEASITKKYHPNLFFTRKLIHEELVSFLEKNKKYHNKNKESVEELYVKNIISCIYNLNKNTSPLSISERKNEIKTIINDDSVQRVVSSFIQSKIKRQLFEKEKQKREGTVIYYLKNLTTSIYIKLIYKKRVKTILYTSNFLLFVNNLRSKSLKY